MTRSKNKGDITGAVSPSNKPRRPQFPKIGELCNGSEILMRALYQEGVKTIFGYPGGAIMPVYDDLLKYTEAMMLGFIMFLYVMSRLQHMRQKVMQGLVAKLELLL